MQDGTKNGHNKWPEAAVLMSDNRDVFHEFHRLQTPPFELLGSWGQRFQLHLVSSSWRVQQIGGGKGLVGARP